MYILFIEVQEPNRKDRKMSTLIVGDMHGDKKNAISIFEVAIKNDCNKIICVGDFGYFPNLPECVEFLEFVSSEAINKGIHFSFVDGNHENHHSLNTFSGNTRMVYPGIEWNFRGKQWEDSGLTFISMGGAYSIDKEHRTMGVDWFPEERIKVKDVWAIEGKKIRLLIEEFPEPVKEEDPIKVQIPLRMIVQNDDAVEHFGLNPWCVADGADGDDLYSVPLNLAKEWGFV